MASPRVFISSTCYDLAEERDAMAAFCSSFGFDVALSERGDVFYHPDLHTHLSCVRETSSCHLFVLIIGGRFGGKYKIEPSKSITNAEYSAAIQSNTPVFTFVKQDVLNDHNLWQKNRDKPFVKDIHYPSIEKQEHADEIFKFIDTVRLAPINNGLFGFRLIKDIHDTLRKQWASMMFDYLQNRSISKQLTLTSDALGNLSVVSSKIEELVKNIYKNIDATGAPQAIETIEADSQGEEFIRSLSQLLEDEKFIFEGIFTTSSIKPNHWWDFLCEFSYCKLSPESDLNNGDVNLLGLFETPIFKIHGALSKSEEIKSQALEKGYDRYKSLPASTQFRIASKYFWTKEDRARAEAQREQRKSEGPT